MKGLGRGPIKIRRSWPKAFKPITKVKQSDKLYDRRKDRLKDIEISPGDAGCGFKD